MTQWGLPTTITVEGVDYPIYSDYRDVLDVLGVLNAEEMHVQMRFSVALGAFLQDVDALPPEHVDAACREMVRFIALGEDDPPDSAPSVRRFDWDQDALLIVADVNKVAGTEIRALEYLHWWTFLAYFSSIGEGRLSTVVGIREKLRKGKPLDEHERQYYRENRAAVDLKTKYTKSEEALLEEFLGLR